MSSPTQRYSPLPPMPTHSDEDQYDYHYILEIDLTVDPPIYNWKLTSKSKKRRVLGDLSKEEASTRRQRRTMMRPVIGENRGINLQNERSYTRPPDRSRPDLTEVQWKSYFIRFDWYDFFNGIYLRTKPDHNLL